MADQHQDLAGEVIALLNRMPTAIDRIRVLGLALGVVLAQADRERPHAA